MDSPLPENIKSVQPGGGAFMQIELAWGRWRRWYLRTFRKGYVRRMADCRRGDTTGAPHEILDPRDLKFCKNQCDCSWSKTDDPFAWRDRLPFARWGLAELLLMAGPLLAATAALLQFGESRNGGTSFRRFMKSATCRMFAAVRAVSEPPCWRSRFA